MKKHLFLKPALFFACAVLGAVSSLLGMCMGFVDGAFVNLALTGTMDQLARVSLLSVLWLVCYLATSSLYFFGIDRYRRHVRASLRQDLFGKIMGQNVLEFNSRNSSTYIADLNTNIDNLTDSYFDTIFDCIYNAANFIGAFVSMLWIDLSNIYIMLILSALCSLVPFLAGKYVEKRSEQYLGGLDAYTARLKDYLSGFLVIKVFSLHSRIMGRHKTYNEDMEYKKMAQNDLDVVLTMIGWFLNIFSTMVTLAFGVWLSIQGRIEGGYTIAMGHLIGQVTGVITSIITISTNLQTAKPIIDRFNGILSHQSVPQDQGETLSDVGELALEDVSFGYTPERAVLEHMTARFEKGKAYALVGESGSGKTTLFNLLLRYYDDPEGRLTINGRDIRSYSSESFYRQVGWIDPNMFLFEDTIRNNLTLYADVPEEALQRAIRAARLEEVIGALPRGLETPVSENGANLSAGQRQRFALARAMIHDPAVYLLDEFTSNLDMQTGTEIENTLLREREKEKIVIHITHKLIPEMLEQYDEILVLKNGRFEESGTFHGLMERKGYFYSLYTMSGAREA